MGHIHLHRLRDHIYHEYIQTNRHQSSIPHQQHLRQITLEEVTGPRQIHTFWRIQTHMPRMQQSIRGPNWTELLHTLWRTQTSFQKQQPHIQLCQTPPWKHTPVWHHTENHANTWISQKRGTPKHTRKISHPHGTQGQQSPKWWTHNIPQCNFLHPFEEQPAIKPPHTPEPDIHAYTGKTWPPELITAHTNKIPRRACKKNSNIHTHTHDTQCSTSHNLSDHKTWET